MKNEINENEPLLVASVTSSAYSRNEKIILNHYCIKRTLLERIFNLESIHNWQCRGRNRFGLSTYEVCLKCGKARQRNGMGKKPEFIDCERIKELDNQFDSNNNYIFKR